MQKHMGKAFVLILAFMMVIVGCNNGSSSNTAAKTEASKGTEKKAEEPKKSDFPKKPITMIVHYSAGGSSDLIARTLAKNAEKYLGQPLVIVNKPGGSTNTGLTELVNSKPDGYTIGTANNGMVLQPILGATQLNYPEMMEPIALVGSVPYALGVSADSPWKTIEDFVKYAKENPGKVKYGTVGVGNTTHMIPAKLAVEAGLKMEDVPMDGGSQAVASLLGGHTQATVQAPSDFKEQVKAGKIRILAVSGPKRFTEDPLFKDVPTFLEKGYNVNVTLWQGFGAPKGIPEDARKVLVEGFQKIINDPDTKAEIAKIGFVTDYVGPVEFGKHWKEETVYLGNLLKETGIMDRLKNEKK